jgi:hypothetical protein
MSKKGGARSWGSGEKKEPGRFFSPTPLTSRTSPPLVFSYRTKSLLLFLVFSILFASRCFQLLWKVTFCPFVLFFDTSWSLPVWLSAPCLVPINMSLCSSSRCAVIWWRHGVFCSRIRLSSVLMGPLGGLRTTECDHFFATLPNPPTPAPPEKQDAPKRR